MREREQPIRLKSTTLEAENARLTRELAEAHMIIKAREGLFEIQVHDFKRLEAENAKLREAASAEQKLTDEIPHH